MDGQLIFGQHLKYVTTKADKTIINLSKLMPRIGGVA